MGLSACGFREVKPVEKPDLLTQCLFREKAIIRDES
jgi:hypothetical protein